MSARAIRRTFAAPFILTIATVSPAFADDKAPPKPPPPDQTNPPKPQPPGKNPPAPTPPPKNPPPPQKPEPAKLERHWTVNKTISKGAKPTDCYVMPEGTCPKVEPGKPMPTCNPPPPQPYTCPDGFSEKVQFKIVLRVGATECFQEREPITCPKGASCNPPPPRKVACPK